MATIRITRFEVTPADADEMLARRADLVTAIRAAYPGLSEARLARLDETSWLDVWRWDSEAQAEAAIAAAHSIPEAGAAFELIRNATADQGEIVDER